MGLDELLAASLAVLPRIGPKGFTISSVDSLAARFGSGWVSLDEMLTARFGHYG